MCELYFDGAWRGNNLTVITDGPPISCPALTSFFRSGHPTCLFCSAGHVCELYYNGAWWRNDLTADANGPEKDDLLLPMTSLFDESVEHVYYIGSYYTGIPGVESAHLYELHYNGAWLSNDLTAAANARSPFPDELSSSVTSLFDGMQHVFYIGERSGYVDQILGFTGHVYELYYDGTWHVNDLTAEAGGPLALVRPMTCLSTP